MQGTNSRLGQRWPAVAVLAACAAGGATALAWWTTPTAGDAASSTPAMVAASSIDAQPACEEFAPVRALRGAVDLLSGTQWVVDASGMVLERGLALAVVDVDEAAGVVRRTVTVSDAQTREGTKTCAATLRITSVEQGETATAITAVAREPDGRTLYLTLRREGAELMANEVWTRSDGTVVLREMRTSPSTT